MILNNYIDAYYVLKNNIDYSLTPIEFLNIVFISIDEILNAREDNRDTFIDEDLKYSFNILNNYFFIKREKYEHFYSRIKHYFKESQKYFKENDLALIRKISKLFSYGQFDISPYIPILIELVRRYDDEIYESFAGILLWTLTEVTLKNSIPSYNFGYNNLQLIVEKEIEKQKHDGDEDSLFGKLLLFIFNKNNINKFFYESKSIYDGSFYSIFEINHEITGFKETYAEIIFMRNKSPVNKGSTLEETGNKFGFTRERARQIQAKLEQKLIEIPRQFMDEGYLFLEQTFYSKRNENPLPYFSFKEFNGFLNKYDETTVNYLYCILKYYKKANLIMDSEYEIFYDKMVFDLDNEIVRIKEKLGIHISQADFDTFDTLKQNIVKKHYGSRTNSTGYYQKGCSLIIITEELLKTEFENGYHAKQKEKNEDYLKMIDFLENSYSIDVSKTNPRSLAATIARTPNVYLVGRGLYKHSDYCSKLSQELFDKIILFIEKRKPSVRYEGIYNHFKKELLQIGVDNYFYLKGILDPILPKEFVPTRDYIKVKKSVPSFKDSVIQKIKNIDDVFTFNDIKSIYPGMKNYMISSYIYEIGSIIKLNNSSYINVEKLNVLANDNDFLLTEINKIFESLNSKYITADKIYSRIKLNNPNFFKKYSLLNSSFNLFSYLNYSFSDILFFKRPFISLEENENISSYYLIKEYLSSLNHFDHSTFSKYINKMNIRYMYSYLELVEVMSEDFVQVDVSKMIKKTSTNINSKFIDELKQSILYYLNSFGEINTLYYKGYPLLPKLNIKWNKYLLVGIIRSYLSEEFEIINTENRYISTDFIIRRCK